MTPTPTAKKLHPPTSPPNEEKFKELILYISMKCFKDPTYGAVKLNKILFFSDVAAYASLSKPITGVQYRKYPHGPAPAPMKYIKERLEQTGDAYEYQVPNRAGHITKQLLACRPPNLDIFHPDEIALVDEIVQECWGLSATELSDLSHQYPGWRLADDEEEIPYFTYFIPKDPVELSDTELTWAKSVAALATAN